MTIDSLDARLQALERYVFQFDRGERSNSEFWTGFDALARDLCQCAFADEAEPELRERYCAILANADDMGYAVPDDELGPP